MRMNINLEKFLALLSATVFCYSEVLLEVLCLGARFGCRMPVDSGAGVTSERVW